MSGVYLTGPDTPPNAEWFIEALKERLGDEWDDETFERGGYRYLYAECCRCEESAEALSGDDESALDRAWAHLAEQQGRKPKQRRECEG